MAKLVIPAKIENVPKGIDFIRASLEKHFIKRKDVIEAMLISEEAMMKLIENANDTSHIIISAKAYFGICKVTMSCGGTKIDEEEISIGIPIDELDQSDEEAIRSVLLGAFKDKISYSRKGKYNYVNISTGNKQRVFVYRSTIAILAGIIAALLVMLLTKNETALFIADNILMPIQTLYLNALSLITAPAVFFSIMIAVTRFAAFSDPGRISSKVMGGYFFTTVLSVALGIFTFKAFEGLNILSFRFSVPRTSTTEGMSIIESIENIIPTNIIDPFKNTDALQLLFVALITGLALSKIGNSVPIVRETAEGFNKLFETIVDVVSEMIPSQAFFSVMLAIIYFGGSSFISSLTLGVLVIIGFVIMFLAYIIIIPIFGRLTPIPFVKKLKQFIKQSAFKSDDVGIVSDTISFCKEKLGVSNKVSGFSIPFGAIGNLDGNCIYLCIAVQFLAYFSGSDIAGTDLLRLLFIIVILSIGSSITPGSAMIALTLLLKQMGISMAVLSIVVVINAFIELIMGLINTTGDIAITLVVAKSENKLNKEVYKKII